VTVTAVADDDGMVPVADIHRGDRVRYLGRWRVVTSAAHHDADGLSLVRFRDGRWLHCAPDHLLEQFVDAEEA
jgi:hypothetical protein